MTKHARSDQHLLFIIYLSFTNSSLLFLRTSTSVICLSFYVIFLFKHYKYNQWVINKHQFNIVQGSALVSDSKWKGRKCTESKNEINRHSRKLPVLININKNINMNNIINISLIGFMYALPWCCLVPIGERGNIIIQPIPSSSISSSYTVSILISRGWRWVW